MAKVAYEDIYEIVKMIPKGRVTSYGAIAATLGIRGSARFVGYAMNSLSGRKDVPAHRVVNRNGLLTGRHHFGAGNEMQHLLEKEGIKVKENKIINFKEVFWDPGEHII